MGSLVACGLLAFRDALACRAMRGGWVRVRVCREKSMRGGGSGCEWRA